MEHPENRADALWSDLSAAALQPLDVSEIADLFEIIRHGARSRALAERLGQAHAVVRLANTAVAGHRTLSPERSALAVVVAAYLTEPALSERWFGYSLTRPESETFGRIACESYAADLVALRTDDEAS